MASYSDWCDEKLSQLSSEESRIPVLKEVKDFLSTAPREEIAKTATTLQLPAVFDCLNDSNSEQVDLACEVLTLCMSNLNLGESTNKYGVFLERALKHPFVGVKLMALKEIERNIKNEDILMDLCKRESLLEGVIACIGATELTAAKTAVEIIKYVGVSDSGIKQLTGVNMLRSLHQVMEVNEIVRFRVYEMLTHICIESEYSFTVFKSTGLLSQMLEELNNTDILLRLNVVELLSQLGVTKHGFTYLELNDTLKKISAMLEGDDLLTIQLCEPGVLKFFGNMAHWKPMQILAKHPTLFQRLFNNFETTDITVIGVSLETLGHIGLTNDGKIALDSTGQMGKTLQIISSTLPTYSTPVKTRGLECLAKLLELEEINNQITSITQKWFSQISENPMRFIWGYTTNPITELRCAGLTILKSLAMQSWGQESIRDYPGFVEFLLDRNMESTKECKESKYEIVALLASSDVFEHQTLKKLQIFVNEGPFYVKAIVEVATERND